MKKHVTFCELSIYERVLPLVSGYLQSYACKDPDVERSYAFERYSTTVGTPLASIAHRLASAESDVYAFSCYVWNIGLVRRLVRELRARRPEALIILGGPQVMGHGVKYLDPAWPRTFVCNGEGEKTFRDFLRETIDVTPDYTRVRGLTFFEDGTLATTQPQDRLRNLDDIPSPFLAGTFDASYSTSIFETNRGCPFGCGFCYWGAATNDRVAKFSEQRIQDELTWLSRQGVVFLFLADANWGMLNRDLAFTEHIAQCARTHGSPRMVYYSAAKNRPAKLTALTEIFRSAGVIAAQPVSLQTMSPTALKRVDRSNIKLESYTELQKDLKEKEISSFTELIWPLPGETLESFKAGLDRLCESDSGTILVYPHLLLHNTPLSQQVEEFDLKRKSLDDGIAEFDLVTGTAEVDTETFQQGMRIFYSLHILHNMGALAEVTRYLHLNGIARYADVFESFAVFCRNNRQFAVADFVEESVARHRYCEVSNYGMAAHLALHTERESVDTMLHQFVSRESWWDIDPVRFLFEIDLLNRPYIYSNSPTRAIRWVFEHAKILNSRSGEYRVQLPAEMVPLIHLLIATGAGRSGQPAPVVKIDHHRAQYAFVPSQGLEHNIGYCHGMMLRARDLFPVWSVVEDADPSDVCSSVPEPEECNLPG